MVWKCYQLTLRLYPINIHDILSKQARKRNPYPLYRKKEELGKTHNLSRGKTLSVFDIVGLNPDKISPSHNLTVKYGFTKIPVSTDLGSVSTGFLCVGGNPARYYYATYHFPWWREGNSNGHDTHHHWNHSHTPLQPLQSCFRRKHQRTLNKIMVIGKCQ